MAIPPDAISHREGASWSVALAPLAEAAGLRFPFALDVTDTLARPHAARHQVLEDDAPLAPSHALHQTIADSGQGAHSFWRDGLVFSTSDGSDPRRNGRTYSVLLTGRLSPWLQAMALPLLLLALPWPMLRLRGAPLARTLPALVLLAALALPLTAWWAPRTTMVVDWLPRALLGVALLGAVAALLRRWRRTALVAATAQRLHRVGVLTMQRLSGRIGLAVVVALVTLSLMRAWSPLERPVSQWPSVRSFSLLQGRLMATDALGFWSSSHWLRAEGTLPYFGARRPLYATLLAAESAVVGGSVQALAAVNALLLAVAIFLAARAAGVVVGTWTALGMLAIVIGYAQHFVGVTTTESLGLSLGAVGLAALLTGLARCDRWRRVRCDAGARHEAAGQGSSDGATETSSDGRPRHPAAGSDAEARCDGAGIPALCLGLFALTLGLLARSGAFFVLPALLAAFCWSFRAAPRRVLCVLLLGAASIALGFAANRAVFALTTDGATAANSNFIYVLFGLASGSDWTEGVRYAAEHGAGLETEKERVQIVLDEAVRRMREHPEVLAASLASGLAAFVGSWGPGLSAHFADQFALPAWMAHVLWGLAGIVGVVLLWKRRPAVGAALALALAGVLASAPWIWNDGAWRVLAPTMPLLALAATTWLSAGSPRFESQRSRRGERGTLAGSAALVSGVTLAVFAMAATAAWSMAPTTARGMAASAGASPHAGALARRQATAGQAAADRSTILLARPHELGAVLVEATPEFRWVGPASVTPAQLWREVEAWGQDFPAQDLVPREGLPDRPILLLQTPVHDDRLGLSASVLVAPGWRRPPEGPTLIEALSVGQSVYLGSFEHVLGARPAEAPHRGQEAAPARPAPARP